MKTTAPSDETPQEKIRWYRLSFAKGALHDAVYARRLLSVWQVLFALWPIASVLGAIYLADNVWRWPLQALWVMVPVAFMMPAVLVPPIVLLRYRRLRTKLPPDATPGSFAFYALHSPWLWPAWWWRTLCAMSFHFSSIDDWRDFYSSRPPL